MGSVYGVEAYPLYWPEGWKRTPAHHRERGRYRVGFAQTRDDLLNELEKLGARDVLISSNIPLRRDGLPYAALTEPPDTGIAIYWTTGPRDAPVYRTIACDKYQSTAANLRALCAAIEAFNILRRSGASQVLEQAYKGFAALPSNGERPWREVLQLHGTGYTFEQIKAAYRLLVPTHHPDTGGTHEKMAELNAAYEAATKFFKEANGTL